MRTCLALVLALGSTAALAVDLDQAAKLGVNQAGWDDLAAWLHADALPNIDAMPLDDVDDTLDNGIELRVTGLRVWANFDGVKITPRTGKLKIEVGVKSVRVHADSIRIRKKVLGNWVSTTCRDTNIHIAEGRALPIVLQVSPSVANRRFRLGGEQAEFSIPENEYRVSGPDRCSGALGVGNLIASIVKSVLKDNRDQIEAAVADELEGSVPELAVQINAALTRTFEFAVSDMPPLPDRDALMTTYPSSVRMTNSSGTFELGVRVSASDKDKNQVVAESLAKGLNTRLGYIGLNPLVITEVFQSLYPDGTDWFELTDDTVPGLREVVNVQAAAGIWPDLDYLALSDDKLRLLVSLPEAPRLEADGNGEVVRVTFPSIAMHFLAPIGGEWVPYSDMQISLLANAVLSERDGRLLVSLAEDRQLTVTGDWAEGYVPEVDLIELDMAEFLLSSVLDYLYASGPIADVSFPEIDWGGAPLVLANPSVTQNYMRLDIFH